MKVVSFVFNRLLTNCCRKGDPFQGSCLTLRNEFSEETHKLTKQETLLRRGTWAENKRVREPRRTAWPRGSQSRVLRRWNEFPGCLRPIILTQGPFWWCTLLNQDGRQREGFWEVVGHVVSPFDLSRTLLVGGGLLVLCSLPGLPVVK